jgi:hypothetical protein
MTETWRISSLCAGCRVLFALKSKSLRAVQDGGGQGSLARSSHVQQLATASRRFNSHAFAGRRWTFGLSLLQSIPLGSGPLPTPHGANPAPSPAPLPFSAQPGGTGSIAVTRTNPRTTDVHTNRRACSTLGVLNRKGSLVLLHPHAGKMMEVESDESTQPIGIPGASRMQCTRMHLCMRL